MLEDDDTLVKEIDKQTPSCMDTVYAVLVFVKQFLTMEALLDPHSFANRTPYHRHNVHCRSSCCHGKGKTTRADYLTILGEAHQQDGILGFFHGNHRQQGYA